MNEKISDGRLNELIALNKHELERVGGVMRGHDAYKQEYLDTVKALEELLSLRSMNKRLVEDGERLYKAIIHARIMFINIEVESDKKYAQDVDSSITAHCALMKEIGG